MGGKGSGVTKPIDRARWVSRGNRRCAHCSGTIFRMEPGGRWRHLDGDAYGLFSCDYRMIGGSQAEPTYRRRVV